MLLGATTGSPIPKKYEASIDGLIFPDWQLGVSFWPSFFFSLFHSEVLPTYSSIKTLGSAPRTLIIRQIETRALHRVEGAQVLTRGGNLRGVG